MREAIALMKQALEIDPSYAPAAALIGWCRVCQRLQGWEVVSNAVAAETVNLARQAVEAGKDESDALWAAAMTLSVFAGEHEMAAAAIDRALALNPNSAHAWMANGFESCSQIPPDAAIEAFDRAMRLSPLDPLNYLFSCGLSMAHAVAGRYNEAGQWADRSLREQPRLASTIRLKIISCVQVGRMQEARKWRERLLEIQPGATIAAYMAHSLVFFHPETLSVFVGSLRKAGLPEG